MSWGRKHFHWDWMEGKRLGVDDEFSFKFGKGGYVRVIWVAVQQPAVYWRLTLGRNQSWNDESGSDHFRKISSWNYFIKIFLSISENTKNCRASLFPLRSKRCSSGWWRLFFSIMQSAFQYKIKKIFKNVKLNVKMNQNIFKIKILNTN